MKIEYDERGIPCIGGWLYLVGLSVCGYIISPIIYIIIDVGLLNSNWLIKYPDYKNALIWEIIFLLFMALYSLIIFNKFFKKRVDFIRHYIQYGLLQIAYTIFIYAKYLVDTKEISGFIASSLYFFILSICLINSKRAKYTFVLNNSGQITLYPPSYKNHTSDIPNEYIVDIDKTDSPQSNVNVEEQRKRNMQEFIPQNAQPAPSNQLSGDIKEPAFIKVIALCPNCSQKIFVPANKWVQITCPSCKKEFEVKP